MTATGRYDMFVGGRWTPAEGGTFDEANPAGGGVFATVADADGSRTVDSAAAAAADWAALPHQDRAAFLHRAADLIVDEASSWIGKAMFECAVAPNILRTAAATAYQVTGEILPAEHGKLSLENGMTHINDCPLYDEPIAPFGGVKSSGVGRYGGHAAIEACTTTRWVTLERGGRHYPF